MSAEGREHTFPPLLSARAKGRALELEFYPERGSFRPPSTLTLSASPEAAGEQVPTFPDCLRFEEGSAVFTLADGEEVSFSLSAEQVSELHRAATCALGPEVRSLSFAVSGLIVEITEADGNTARPFFPEGTELRLSRVTDSDASPDGAPYGLAFLSAPETPGGDVFRISAEVWEQLRKLLRLPEVPEA